MNGVKTFQTGLQQTCHVVKLQTGQSVYVGLQAVLSMCDVSCVRIV